jgi:hypothetical protein
MPNDHAILPPRPGYATDLIVNARSELTHTVGAGQTDPHRGNFLF